MSVRSAMREIKMTLAYDGTAYSGWQVQAKQRTVQGVVEAALAAVTGAPVRIVASGRTDAGVHALGQVVGFSIDSHLSCDVLKRAIQGNLPADVSVRELELAPAGFHPIRDAKSKRYRYVLSDAEVHDVFTRAYCWQTSGPVCVSAMQRAAGGLVGRHDFASFQSSGAPRESTVRTIYDLHVSRLSDAPRGTIWIEVEADGFLYNMVRAIVGTLAEVGRGAQDEAWCGQVLALCNRSQAGPTAPPQGLFLVSVDYGTIFSTTKECD